ncbi:hypothetical protein PsorP6_014294 [Peronosclerospora sorghi]|uniref:Uncharacterized protein n=1 Tax=Peronosclerospora sorghi TaxID=230839 RepID=A0ACC0VHN8_9STRA|nr:hypothetical protein PsorP6_014294 [Peronosclerospora sorghi]
MGDYRLYVVVFAVQQEEMDEAQREREWNDNEASMSGADNESETPLVGVAMDVSDERRILIPAEAFTDTLDRRYAYLSNKPCGCQSSCPEKFGEQSFFGQARRLLLDCESINRKEKRATMVKIITVGLASDSLDAQRLRPTYSLPWLGEVCKTHFVRFWNVSDKTIKNILKHVRNNRSMLPKPHGLCGRRNAATSVEACTAVEEFLFETSRKYGEAVAIRKYTRRKGYDGAILTTLERDDIIFLPSFFTQSGLFGAFKSGSNNAFDIFINTFNEIWHGNDVLAKLKIWNPEKDVCDECFIFRNKQAVTASMLEFEGVCDDQAESVSTYKVLHQEYEADHEQAMRGGPAAVFTFDYSQNVPIPHNTQQPGGHNVQYNFLYTEGKSGKGSSEVASLVDHALSTIHITAKYLVFWAENCGDQNKNQTMMQFFLSLVESGRFDQIDYKFQVKGHNRNTVNRGFA